MKNKSLIAVFLVVLIDLMGFGIVLPLLPFYSERFHATPVVLGFLYSIYSIAQLFFSPFWGALSDRVGRRPVMLTSTFGSSMSYLVFAFSRSLRVLFFSRLLAGMMGGNIATAQAYIADVTAPEDRAKGMGLLGAAFGIGFTIGPAIATLFIHPAFHSALAAAGLPAFGTILAAHGFAVLGLGAMTLSLSSFLLVLLWLPETIVPGASTAGRDRAGVISIRFWRGLFAPHRSRFFLLLSLSAFLLSFAYSSLYSAFPLFARDRLGLTAAQVGTQYAVMGLVAALIQGGLIRHLVKRFREESLFLVGSAFMVIGMLFLPLAWSARALTGFLSFLAIGSSLNGPTLYSLVSKESEETAYGETMGMVQGLSALGRAGGPTWGGWLFGLSSALPFVATSFILAFTVYVGARMRASTPSPSRA